MNAQAVSSDTAHAGSFSGRKSEGPGSNLPMVTAPPPGHSQASSQYNVGRCLISKIFLIMV